MLRYLITRKLLAKAIIISNRLIQIYICLSNLSYVIIKTADIYFLPLLTTESYTWFLPRNYTQSGTFWIYGDSLGLRLFRSVKRRSLCKSLYKQCKNSYTWIYPVHDKKIVLNDALGFRPSKVIETIVNVLREPEMKENGSVLLLNLLMHFVKVVNFTTYQKLIDDLILALKETEVNPQGEQVPKYMAKVIWKSGTAIHKEKAKSLNMTSFRFFTSQVCTLTLKLVTMLKYT